MAFYRNSSRDQLIDFFVGWRGIRQKENQETCRGEMIIFLIRIIIRKPNSIIFHFLFNAGVAIDNFMKKMLFHTY